MDRNMIPSVSLAGEWQFRLDPQNQGCSEQWYNLDLPERIMLPGTTDTGGYGWQLENHSLKNLTRKYTYMGTAWYRKEIEISDSQSCYDARLFLERCLWDTALWLDGKKIGTQNSLAAPHVYQLGKLSPGRHILAVAVDNANLKEGANFEDLVIAEKSYKTPQDLKNSMNPFRRLNCGGHHTMFLMETNWNGIIGEISLRFCKALHLEKMDVFPRADLKSAEIRIMITNKSRIQGKGSLQYTIEDTDGRIMMQGSTFLNLSGTEQESLSFFLTFTENMEQWNEFSPILYRIKTELTAGNSVAFSETEFGIRYLESKNGKFLLNGSPVFLRGTIEDCTFPLTFYPPTDDAAWDRIFRIAKSYGLNHLRFHTFCPPDAAFRAADRAGFLLQAELPGTSCPGQDEDPAVTEFLLNELDRILCYYGNHPSFAGLSMGNEQLINLDNLKWLRSHQKMLMGKVEHARKTDPRHLYTCTSHPYTDGRNDDYFVSAWSKKGWEFASAKEIGFDEFHEACGWEGFLCGIRWSGPNPPTSSIYCVKPPTLCRDFDEGMEGIDRPVISHEVGQWAVYPNVEEMPKYTGVLYPGNMEIIRKSLKENGLLPLISDFVKASGQLSLMLYRDEIETLLKSKTISGFQLLDLFDYPGQGTSTVGILDAFWDSKGLISPEEFRHFCGPGVILARIPKRVWIEGEPVEVSTLCANFTGKSYQNAAVHWILRNADGSPEQQGILPECDIANGTRAETGHFLFTAKQLSFPREVQLELSVPVMGIVNSWKLWIYPAEQKVPAQIETQWNAAVKERLNQGEDVLLCPAGQGETVPGVFTTSFWNPIMKKQVGTYGILCKNQHPVFKSFPTSFHTDWQWWDILANSWSVVLGNLDADPIIRVIDSFTTNRSLGMMFEARVGKGRLLVCCASLTEKDAPASRQLAASIAEYMNSDDFHPVKELSVTDLDQLFH